MYLQKFSEDNLSTCYTNVTLAFGLNVRNIPEKINTGLTHHSAATVVLLYTD